MNPLDFHGPQFLVFYICLSVLLHILVRRYLSFREKQQEMPKIAMSDPYQIAYLRGTSVEAIRIAVLSLIDRGLIRITNLGSKKPQTLQAANAVSADIVQRPIEKAILRYFEFPLEAHQVLSNRAVIATCQEYQDQLGRAGLVAIPATKHARIVPVLFTGAVLAGSAAAKIMVALERGHHNIGLLITFSVVSLVCLGQAISKHRTGLGDEMLKDLKALFAPLYARRNSLQEGGRTNEAALVAAIFGVSAVSTVFYYAKSIFPMINNDTNGSCGGGCGGGGSSCGGCGGCGS